MIPCANGSGGCGLRGERHPTTHGWTPQNNPDSPLANAIPETNNNTSNIAARANRCYIFPGACKTGKAAHPDAPVPVWVPPSGPYSGPLHDTLLDEIIDDFYANPLACINGSVSGCVKTLGQAAALAASGSASGAVRLGIRFLIYGGRKFLEHSQKSANRRTSAEPHGYNRARSTSRCERAGIRSDARSISRGHAWNKHVTRRGEFPDVHSQDQFARIIERTMLRGESRQLQRGRSAYWYRGVVVVRNPADRDAGTAFRPPEGHDYFTGLN